MSELRISELLLVSDLERSARRVRFHPQTTVILGKNDTGKSSVLKSIYQTFSAEPAKLHPDWRQAHVTSLVRFQVDESAYAIMRRADFYAIFGANGDVLATFDRVTEGLAPFLAGLFSFEIKLPSKQRKLITPPPAYFFLPYYIDQDVGWVHNWSSFSRLQQIPNWRRSIVEYHTGLKPNEYYLAKAELADAEQELQRVQEELRVLGNVRDRVLEGTPRAEFAFSLEDFREQLDDLLRESRGLLEMEEQLKARLTDLSNDKLALEGRLSIVKHALAETSADYEFATEELTDDTVECPTCGAIYDNSFTERFQIARDEDSLAELALSLQQELRASEIAIAAERERFNDNHAQVQRVRSLLNTKREQVSLGMVLQNEGRKEVNSVLKAKVEEFYREQGSARDRADGHRRRLKEFEDRKRRDEVLTYYRHLMRAYLNDLQVDRLPEKAYRSIDARVHETGSDQPRALLAYYFSILHVIKLYSSSTYCPLVLDSPNQQAQDVERLPLMLRFIRDTRPADTQLILGVEDLYGVDFDGDVVELQNRNKVLQDTQYDEVREELRPLMASVLTG